jgi:hypothetical protein
MPLLSPAMKRSVLPKYGVVRQRWRLLEKCEVAQSPRTAAISRQPLAAKRLMFGPFDPDDLLVPIENRAKHPRTHPTLQVANVVVVDSA